MSAAARFNGGGLIEMSADGNLYRIHSNCGAARFWMEAKTRPGHVGADEQTQAQAQGKLWINCTTKGGRRYHRAVIAPEQVESGLSAPITERNIKFKDYALFHRWGMPAAVAA